MGRQAYQGEEICPRAEPYIYFSFFTEIPGHDIISSYQSSVTVIISHLDLERGHHISRDSEVIGHTYTWESVPCWKLEFS